MLDKDHLEDQMTVIDATSLTAPWRISRTYERVAHVHPALNHYEGTARVRSAIRSSTGISRSPHLPRQRDLGSRTFSGDTESVR